MAKIRLLNPAKGMYTAVDQQDLPPQEGFADLISNYYMDRPGKLRKRDGTDILVTDLAADGVVTIRGLLCFVDEDLTGNRIWIAAVVDATASQVALYTAADAATPLVWTELYSVAATAAELTNWFVHNGVLRIFHGLELERWYGYHDIDDFWHNQYDPADGWTLLSRALAYPTQWVYNDIFNADPGKGATVKGAGTLIAGYYRYRAVPVFDGTQEALFGEGYLTAKKEAVIQVADAEQNSVLLFSLTLSEATWNNRITSINLYRAYNIERAPSEDAAFQLVDSISVRNEDPPETLTDLATMQSLFYLPDEAMGVNDYIYDNSGGGTYGSPQNGDFKYALKIDSGSFKDILSNTATALTLQSTYLAGQQHVAKPWEIYKRSRVFGAWVTVDGPAILSGTNGWGGGYVWLSDAQADANHTNGELVGKVVKYNSQSFGVIVGNHKLAVALSAASTVPITGTSKTISFANNMWFVNAGAGVLYWADLGRTDKGAHPLDGVTSITATAKYNVFWKGRLFGLYARVTNKDTSTTDYPAGVIYSEVGQLDVSPADFIFQPDTDRGGIGQGIEILEGPEVLVLFYRNDIEYVSVPYSDPDSWKKWGDATDSGLVAPAAKVKTPLGIFFCSDDGIYLIDSRGSMRGPVSQPIQNTYLATVLVAASSFTAVYFPQQRQVLFSFGTPSEMWVLDIDSVQTFPRWSKYAWGSSRTINRGALSETNELYLFDTADNEIYRMGEAISGDESYATTYRTAAIKAGSMERLNLVRDARLSHKGILAITPTVYLNDGTESEAKTALAAAANGTERAINIKRRARNFALQLATAVSTSTVHEITGIEIEVADE